MMMSVSSAPSVLFRTLAPLCCFSLLASSCAVKENPAEVPGSGEMISYNIPSSSVPGELFVRVSPDIAGTKSGMNIADAVASNAALSSIAVEQGITRFERLFPVNPKFEARTHEAGLDCWFTVSFDKSGNSESVARALLQCPGVLFVEAPATVSIPASAPASGPVRELGPAASEPGRDVLFPFNEGDEVSHKQWHYNNTGSVSSYSSRRGADANVWNAWRYCMDNGLSIGTPDVIVAVIDQGVMYSHEDLAANMWVNPGEVAGNGIDDDGNGYVDDIYGYNFTERTSMPTFSHSSNHGTHVAGTIAAVNNNGKGVNGIAGGSKGNGEDGVRIMSLQALGGPDQTNSSGLGGIVRAMKYAADNGAVVCQNSWGYTGQVSYMAWNRSSYSALRDVMNYFIRYAGIDENGRQTGPMKGGIIIFASGNEGKNELCYPAAADNCIGVSSISYTGDHAYYSNYGTWVDMSAPGGEMTWDDKGGVYSTSVEEDGGSGYCFLQGTSMACPHVSGACALAVSYYRQRYGMGLRPEALRQALLSSCRNEDSWMESSYVGKMGVGNLDAYRLLLAMDRMAAADGFDMKLSVQTGEIRNVDFSPLFLDASVIRYYGYDSSVVEVKGSSAVLAVRGLRPGQTKIRVADAAATEFELEVTVK